MVDNEDYAKAIAVQIFARQSAKMKILLNLFSTAPAPRIKEIDPDEWLAIQRNGIAYKFTLRQAISRGWIDFSKFEQRDESQ